MELACMTHAALLPPDLPQAYCHLSTAPSCRVAEGLLQRLFPRDAQDAAGVQGQRFKGMLKVQNPPACVQLVSCQEFHMPLIECALQLVYAIIVARQVSLCCCAFVLCSCTALQRIGLYDKSGCGCVWYSQVFLVDFSTQVDMQEPAHVSSVLQRQDRAALLWQAARCVVACSRWMHLA